MIVISGRARLLESEVGRALPAASAMAETSRAESGCLDYRFAMDIDDPLVAHLFEVWESEESLVSHFGTPHFAAFAETLVGVVDGDAEFTRYEVSSAAPLFG